MVKRIYTVNEANEIVREIKPILGGIVKAYRYGDPRVIQSQSRWLLRLANRLGIGINVESGVIHFPTLYKGKYNAVLCYKYGEDSVTHWHMGNGGARLRIRDPSLFGPIIQQKSQH